MSSSPTQTEGTIVGCFSDAKSSGISNHYPVLQSYSAYPGGHFDYTRYVYPFYQLTDENSKIHLPNHWYPKEPKQNCTKVSIHIKTSPHHRKQPPTFESHSQHCTKTKIAELTIYAGKVLMTGSVHHFHLHTTSIVAEKTLKKVTRKAHLEKTFLQLLEFLFWENWKNFSTFNFSSAS